MLRKIGQYHVRPSPADTEQRLRHGLLEVEPTIAAGGQQHGTLAAHVVGSNGQVSLGKTLAGKIVSIDQIDKGTWIIKSGEFVPDSQKWLYESDNMQRLDNALALAEKSPARVNNSEEIINKIEQLTKIKNVSNQA